MRRKEGELRQKATLHFSGLKKILTETLSNGHLEFHKPTLECGSEYKQGCASFNSDH